MGELNIAHVERSRALRHFTWLSLRELYGDSTRKLLKDAAGGTVETCGVSRTCLYTGHGRCVTMATILAVIVLQDTWYYHIT